jgi:hypothetical protein
MTKLNKFFVQYSIVFTITSIIIYILAMGSLRVSDNFIFRPQVMLIGLLIIALLITLSLITFNASWGNGVINIIVSYLIIIPIPFITRIIFLNRIFRLFQSIYILLGLYLIGYLLYTWITHASASKEKNVLNHLLKEKKGKATDLD